MFSFLPGNNFSTSYISCTSVYTLSEKVVFYKWSFNAEIGCWLSRSVLIMKEAIYIVTMNIYILIINEAICIHVCFVCLYLPHRWYIPFIVVHIRRFQYISDIYVQNTYSYTILQTKNHNHSKPCYIQQYSTQDCDLFLY